MATRDPSMYLVSLPFSLSRVLSSFLTSLSLCLSFRFSNMYTYHTILLHSLFPIHEHLLPFLLSFLLSKLGPLYFIPFSPFLFFFFSFFFFEFNPCTRNVQSSVFFTVSIFAYFFHSVSSPLLRFFIFLCSSNLQSFFFSFFFLFSTFLWTLLCYIFLLSRSYSSYIFKQFYISIC